jgi:MFS-type transporter involved in bile tolerance (Atg22 family)
MIATLVVYWLLASVFCIWYDYSKRVVSGRNIFVYILAGWVLIPIAGIILATDFVIGLKNKRHNA